jgi:ribonuclease HI
MIIYVHIDGGARGNPGLAGVGVVIKITPLREVWQFKKFIGTTTNNQAEYSALILALEKVGELIERHHLEVDKIVCYSDSELLVSQMRRIYKVKDKELGLLFIKAWNLSQKLPKIEYQHILREENREADLLANQAIDENSKF